MYNYLNKKYISKQLLNNNNDTTHDNNIKKKPGPKTNKSTPAQLRASAKYAQKKKELKLLIK